MIVCNKYSCICILLHVLRYCKFVEGFNLSPVGDVYICLGGQTSLTCVTDRRFMEWKITAQNYIGLRLVSSVEATDITPLTVNYTTFSFTRESHEPLNVTLSVINATVDLKIFCIKDLKSASLTDALVTTINVLASQSDVSLFLNHPELIMIEESFEENNISLALRLKRILSKEDLSYSISFTVTPHVHTIEIVTSNNESAMMIMPYNTLCNVTVFGNVKVCGFSGALSSVVSLFYANCSDPSPPQLGYLNFYTSTLEGAEVNVTCPSGLREKLACDHEGKWHPNSTDVCVSTPGYPSASRDAIIIAVVLSTAVFFLSIAIVIISVYVCRRKVCQKVREAVQYSQFTDEDINPNTTIETTIDE